MNRDFLISLGITPNYKGFYLILDALALIENRPDALIAVTKEIYPEIASRYRISWHAVERDIRTVLQVVWRAHHAELCKLFGCELRTRPTTAQFLGVLAQKVNQMREFEAG